MMDGVIRRDTERYAEDVHRRSTRLIWRSSTCAPSALGPCDELAAGDVGLLRLAKRNVADTRVGDTVTGPAAPRRGAPPERYRPHATDGLLRLCCSGGRVEVPRPRDSEKLKLNDASLSYGTRTRNSAHGLRLPAAVFTQDAAYGDNPGGLSMRTLRP